MLEYEKTGSNIRMKVCAEAGSYVDTTLLFFQGYKAYDENGNGLPCAFGVNNRMRIQFPVAYEGEVYVHYKGHNRWRIFDILSIFSLLAFMGSCIISRNRKKIC